MVGHHRGPTRIPRVGPLFTLNKTYLFNSINELKNYERKIYKLFRNFTAGGKV